MAIADSGGPPAPFVRTTLNRLARYGFSGQTAIDVGCGFGRHSVYLAQNNYSVTGIDIENRCIERFESYFASRPNLRARGYHMDAYCSPHAWNGLFDLCVVVDFVRADIVPVALRLIRPGGYVIYQSVGNRGGNWTQLPRRGEMLSTIASAASVVSYEECQAGPDYVNSVKVRFVARRYDVGESAGYNSGK